MADIGIDALVLISNRFASQEDDNDVWRKRLCKCVTEFF
jgi:hypothetical protein